MTATTAEELARTFFNTVLLKRSAEYPEQIAALAKLLTTFSERARGEAIPTGAKLAEILGPDGNIHYRRPVGDPMIAEAQSKLGYAVRYVETETVEYRGVKCAANPTADPPQDCNWPFCGCDPKASDVLEALSEMDLLKDRSLSPTTETTRTDNG